MDLRKGKTVFLAGVLTLVVIWMILFIGRIADENRLSEENQEAASTILALEATVEALATEVVYAGSDAAAKEWAREDGILIQEGDQRIAVIPMPGTPPAPVPPPTPVPAPQNPFRVWWELYFNTKP